MVTNNITRLSRSVTAGSKTSVTPRRRLTPVEVNALTSWNRVFVLRCTRGEVVYTHVVTSATGTAVAIDNPAERILTIGTDCNGIDAPLIAFDEINIKYQHAGRRRRL
jgi:hypothetical protein